MSGKFIRYSDKSSFLMLPFQNLFEKNHFFKKNSDI